MIKIGVFIVGTSPLPIYISIKNFLELGGNEIYLLATENDGSSNGTMRYAERLKKCFYEENIEIIKIDRSSIVRISNKLSETLKYINDIDEKTSVYLDYTGGTKLQSAYIRKYVEDNIDEEKEVIVSYVDGYEKRIMLKNKRKGTENNIEFDEIDGHDDDDNICEIARLHGIKIDKKDSFEIINELDKKVFDFKHIGINNFTLIFSNKLKCDISNEKIGKAKLEFFNNIVIGEKVGGSFSEFNFIVSSKKVDKYCKLEKEFLGIKKYLYDNRIYFNKE